MINSWKTAKFISNILFIGIIGLFFCMTAYTVHALDQEKINTLEYHKLASERLQHAALCYERWQNSGDAEFFQEALIYAASAAEIRPDWNEPWVLLGLLYSEIKVDQEAMNLAVEALLNAVKTNPANARAQVLLANTLLEQGRFYSAIEQYKSLFAKNKKMVNGVTITPLTTAYIADGRVKAGIIYLKDLAELYPDNISVRVGLAVLLKNNQQLEEAQQILTDLTMDGYSLGNEMLTEKEKKYINKLRDSWKTEDRSDS